MKISYSYGIVDLLHYGHIKALKEAKEGADLHIFGLVSDEATKEWMGSVISNYDERYNVLKSIDIIDEIMLQKTLDPYDNLYKIYKMYPNAEITLYHGNNFKVIPAENFLKSINGKIVLTEYYGKMSPENILKKLNDRNSRSKRVNNLISTKANTLFSLKSRLNKSKIEDMYIFTVEQFMSDSNYIYSEIANLFQLDSIVVRSSSSNEDCFETSNAGHFESVLNVDASNKEDVISSIKKVIASYKLDSTDCGTEQVLIQRMTRDVKVGGVVFTRELYQNRPYYLINYDDNGSTDSVTSGMIGKTIWVSHNIELSDIPSIWSKLIESIKEIEALLDEMVLDIEFAILSNDEIVIFQVRPLAASYKIKNDIDDNRLFATKEKEKLRYRNMICDFNSKIMNFSDMAFWNPSEIIGTNPRNLDYSLYREIITKSAWNEGLVPMGYNFVDKDLMYKIGNKPYISLEYSFVSLIPQEVDIELRNKIMNFYLHKLKKDTSAHDKIEFEIILSCYDFETDNKLKEFYDYGFSHEEIFLFKKSLFILTNNCLKTFFKTLETDLLDVKILSNKRENIEKKLLLKKDNIYNLMNYFVTLITDIRKYGTPQFSRQARYAFISRSFCKALVSQGYFSEEDMDKFMLSVSTVASEFEKDFNEYVEGTLSKDKFNKKYGHLRSGTYDIRAKRYDEINFETDKRNGKQANTKSKDCTDLNLQRLQGAINKINLDIGAETLISIMREAISQREYFKFEFTKSLSLAIEVLAQMGRLLGFEKEEMSYLEMSDILASEYYENTEELKNFWQTIINQRRADFAKKSQMILPEIILSEKDLDFIHLTEQRPNFITTKEISGEYVLLEENNDADIFDKIVLISKADPGFDWIFSQGIKGLITKYGGAASHMAIRCAEFGIPAAIGCGEKIYSSISNYTKIRLDCKNKKIDECEYTVKI